MPVFRRSWRTVVAPGAGRARGGADGHALAAAAAGCSRAAGGYADRREVAAIAFPAIVVYAALQLAMLAGSPIRCTGIRRRPGATCCFWPACRAPAWLAWLSWSGAADHDSADRRLAAPAQANAEAGRGQSQQHLAGRCQRGDLGRAEFLKFSQVRGVRVRVLPAGTAQNDRVGPHLLARFAEKALRAQPADRTQQAIQQRARPGYLDQLVFLGGYTGGEHAINCSVISLPASQDGHVVEFGVG